MIKTTNTTVKKNLLTPLVLALILLEAPPLFAREWQDNLRLGSSLGAMLPPADGGRALLLWNLSGEYGIPVLEDVNSSVYIGARLDNTLQFGFDPAFFSLRQGILGLAGLNLSAGGLIIMPYLLLGLDFYLSKTFRAGVSVGGGVAFFNYFYAELRYLRLFRVDIGTAALAIGVNIPLSKVIHKAKSVLFTPKVKGS